MLDDTREYMSWVIFEGKCIGSYSYDSSPWDAMSIFCSTSWPKLQEFEAGQAVVVMNVHVVLLALLWSITISPRESRLKPFVLFTCPKKLFDPNKELDSRARVTAYPLPPRTHVLKGSQKSGLRVMVMQRPTPSAWMVFCLKRRGAVGLWKS